MSSVGKPAPSVDDSSPSMEVSRPITDPDPVSTTFHDDHVVRTQDAAPIRERMRELKNRGHAGWSPSRDFKLAAEFPNLMLEKWGREDGINFMQLPKREFFKWATRKAMLNDCEDFLMGSNESFRAHMSGVYLPAPAKPKPLLVPKS